MGRLWDDQVSDRVRHWGFLRHEGESGGLTV